MYDFCPLDLFSGNYSRMRKAIHSLFLVPHRNLRIFVDGNLVHSDEKPLEKEHFSEILFPRKEATEEDLVKAVSRREIWKLEKQKKKILKINSGCKKMMEKQIFMKFCGKKIFFFKNFFLSNKKIFYHFITRKLSCLITYSCAYHFPEITTKKSSASVKIQCSARSSLLKKSIRSG